MKIVHLIEHLQKIRDAHGDSTEVSLQSDGTPPNPMFFLVQEKSREGVLLTIKPWSY